MLLTYEFTTYKQPQIFRKIRKRDSVVLTNNSDKELTLISIMMLKVLMYLHYIGGKVKFIDLKRSMNRSKSQLSVLLKKMEKKNLITKSLNRPIIISVTDNGEKTRRNAINELAKFKNEGSNKNKIKNTKKDERIENFTRIVERIIKNEILQRFKHNIQGELVRDIVRTISAKINDLLYSFLNRC